MKDPKFSMKIAAIVTLGLAFSLCYCLVLSAQVSTKNSLGNNEPKQELLITITSYNDKKLFVLGEPIQLDIMARNTGEKSIFLIESCDSLDYKLIVRTQSGDEVNLTKEGRHLTNYTDLVCHFRAIKLAPVGTKRVSLDVSRLYDMKTKGLYYITAIRGALTTGYQQIRATSNIFEIRIN